MIPSPISTPCFPAASPKPTLSMQRSTRRRLTDDERTVVRQAFAGLLWSKQYYHYDVYRWLKGDPDAAARRPKSAGTDATRAGRNCTTPT